jgi:immune inhibitor InhA-like protein
MRRSRLLSAAAALLLVPLLQVLPASSVGAAPGGATAPASDVRELTKTDFSNFKLDGKPLSAPAAYSPKAKAQTKAKAAAAGTPAVGTVRQWLGTDDANNLLYRKDYTLRAVGQKIEVWVANDTAFPAGDCRSQIPDSTTVTDAQAAELVDQFDNNMFPKETTTFSTPPDRDGTNAVLGPDANGNGGDYTGDGDKTVALIDNVRDANFYNFPAAATYIAGFFSAQYNELLDRNVMTIDAFDWAHRSGANPPDEPTADPCTSRPGRPHLYEGTFAHEWQHLLHRYTDPFETTWMNEGLSDFAQTLVGYVDGNKTVFDKGGDSHIYCYQGFGSVQTPFNPNPRDCGGPENSLNLWNEGTPDQVLSDYGHAYSLMLFLFDRYGTDFMSRLHQDGQLQGLASLDAALEAEGVHDMYQVLHDFQSSTLLDKMIGDSPHGVVIGVPRKRVTSPSLRASVNFGNPNVNDNPGAGPNGADYVSPQNANGTALRGRDLRSLNFQGAASLPALPLKWTIVNDDPDRPGNPVLFSGNANNTDATAVTSVAVPAADPTLRFNAKYGAEFGFDYGYVMISTDGGVTYTAIPGDHTVDAPLGPGLNGTTNGFEPRSYDLSAYAGQNVLVAIRYVSDGGVNEGGLEVDDIIVGGTAVSDGSSLDPFDSPTEIHPLAVNNWNVKLIGYDEANHVALQAEFNGKNSIRLGTLQTLIFGLFPKVAVIVAYDEPTEQVQQYAPYTLTVNGVVQPGGGGAG